MDSSQRMHNAALPRPPSDHSHHFARAAAIPAMLALTALAAAWASDLPEGTSGIAAQFPGDVGIENHEAVLFVERFDGTLDEITGRWDDAKRPDIFSLSDERPPGSADGHSLLITHVGGDETGGHLYRRLPEGIDVIHWRFYTRIDADAAPMHHTSRIGGHHPPQRWPSGGAGTRPGGAQKFSVGVGPHYGPDQSWDFYTYWHEMRGSPPRGQTWGNTFIRNPELTTTRGEWTCVEVMIKLNDPGQHNGELALWLDGKLAAHLVSGSPTGTWIWDKFTPGHTGPGVRWSDEAGGREEIPGNLPFEGFNWRTSNNLDINFLWLLVFITQAPENHVSRVWFDHVVLASDYIGPIQCP